jgi:hypothetical protein
MVKFLQRRWGLTNHASLHLSGLVAAYPGCVVTSGRRSRVRNRLVGGIKGSFHLQGRAADVVIPRDERAAFIAAAWSQRVTASCTGPEEVINEGDHVHLAW